MYGAIIVPLDGSDAASRALVPGLRLAEAEYYAAPPFPWLFGSRPGPAVSTMLLLVFDRG